jgi:hypothetical protein
LVVGTLHSQLVERPTIGTLLAEAVFLEYFLVLEQYTMRLVEQEIQRIGLQKYKLVQL